MVVEVLMFVVLPGPVLLDEFVEWMRHNRAQQAADSTS